MPTVSRYRALSRPLPTPVRGHRHLKNGSLGFSRRQGGVLSYRRQGMARRQSLVLHLTVDLLLRGLCIRQR